MTLRVHPRTSAPDLAPVALALLAGSALIVTHRAAHYSLWYDEAWSLAAVRGRGAAGIVEALQHDFHPPAYFLALGAWAAAAGLSEFALRYLSALAAVLCLAAAGRLAMDLFRSKTAGAFAILVLASMPFHIRYAQEVRMYAWLAALAVASMLLYRRVASRPGPALGAACVLVTAAALYVHYLALFLVALQAGYGLLGTATRPARSALSTWSAALLPFGAFVLFLPWLPAFFAQLHSPDYGNVHSFALPTDWPTVATTLNQYLFAGQTWFYAPLIVVGCVGLASGPRWRIGLGRPRALGFLAAWGLGWLALAWASNLVVPQFQPRNALPALPALAILVGGGLSRLPRAVGLALLGLCLALNLSAYDRVQAKDPHYRDAVQALADGYQPGDLIFVQTNSFLHDLPLRHYLDTLLPPHPEPIWLNDLPGGLGSAEANKAFAAQAGAARRFWFLQTLPVDNGWVAQAVPAAESWAVEVDAFRVTLYERQ